MSFRKSIRFTLNGEVRTLDVDPWEILLDTLRERLGIKSPKIGCERGECGTCTVLLDGKPVRSCLILAVEADGRELVTVEGLNRDGLSPLQEKFLEHNSFQCGFCAPGFVVAATALLQQDPSPDREAVREALDGHLCRCTGYTPILDAVVAAGKKT
ncbi:MAG: (2Fe-2S)-binding protein [Acidobacteria bacterium]|nr:(2Fe-2S)-binding protein [Acidobacteriota bacterium]